MVTIAILSVLVLLASLLAASTLSSLRRLFRTGRVEDITPEWLETFSVSFYRPMGDILDVEDFAFLSSQPGFDPALYRKFRRDRLEIFRQYLNRMISDFNRLHLTARLLLAHAPEDQSDVMLRLIRLRVLFTISVLRVEFRYALCRAGLHAVSVTSLITRLEEMSRQVAYISAMETAKTL